jgi:hypothetical protein
MHDREEERDADQRARDADLHPRDPELETQNSGRR